MTLFIHAHKRGIAAFLILIALTPAPNLRADDGEVEYVVVKAGRVITISGEEFAPGTIVIEDGKISLVGGSKIEYPPSSRVIRAPHQTVMPGFIHPRTRLGLERYSRSGVHGDQKASDEVFLSELDFDDLLEAGYTTVAFVPAGKGIPGLASVYRTAGAEESRLIADTAYLDVAVNWSSNGKKMLRGALKKAKDEIEKVKKAREEWDKKQEEKKKQEEAKKEKDKQEKPKEEPEKNDKSTSFAKPDNGDDEDKKESDKPDEKEKPKEPEKFKPPKIDPKHQPLVDLIEKKKGASILVQLGRASDAHHLADVLEPYDELPHSLFLGSTRRADYNYIVDFLGEQKARVVLKPWLHFLPDTTFRYNLMAKLAQAGCSISTVPYSDTRAELMGVRKRLADLVRAGLSREDALKSLTLHPAEVLGLADRLGSLEKDRDADLVFLDGDPLDPHTKVRRVMILGETVWTADEK